jgi:hypothetical protein
LLAFVVGVVAWQCLLPAAKPGAILLLRTYLIRFIASCSCTTSDLNLVLSLQQHSHENHKAQLAAQRDSEQTLMKTFKQKETGRRKSVHSLMSRVNLRRSNLTGGDYTPGAYYRCAVLLVWCRSAAGSYSDSQAVV